MPVVAIVWRCRERLSITAAESEGGSFLKVKGRFFERFWKERLSRPIGLRGEKKNQV